MFVDPHEWVGKVSYLDPQKFGDHTRLIAETRKKPEELDLAYLERQAVYTTRPIKAGEEILIDYRRWGG